jgi:hypothetical protein
MVILIQIKQELFSRTALRSQYIACQPAASVSRLGESSGRLATPRNTGMMGSVGASPALIRRALPIFPVLASRSAPSSWASVFFKSNVQ